MSRLNPRTAPPDRSIWQSLPEPTFRQHLVDLEKRTNAVPIDPTIFPLPDLPSPHTLPLPLEQSFTNDLAYLAAIEEGAQSVAAVCLEHHTSPPRLTARFAALDLSLSQDVKTALRDILDDVRGLPGTTDVASYSEIPFEKIVKLHERRLLARLRSEKWVKPRYLSRQHKKPLCADFSNLVHRVQFLYGKREAAMRKVVEGEVKGLEDVYLAFERQEAGSEREFSALKEVVKGSFAFCKNESVRGYAKRLEDSIGGTPTRQVASAMKTLRQVEKIGAYWRVAVVLVKTSVEYPELFRERVGLAFLTPYESVPTRIGYEAWATSCHVHAEVQLVVYYDLAAHRSRDRASGRAVGEEEGGCEEHDLIRPRVIGTSKWLCYLCYLFLRSHGGFAVANSHGRLYDQWTVPDLKEFEEETCAQYRGIIRGMDDEVLKETKNGNEEALEEESVRWRAEPMTSRQNLLLDDDTAISGVEVRNIDQTGEAVVNVAEGIKSLEIKD